MLNKYLALVIGMGIGLLSFTVFAHDDYYDGFDKRCNSPKYVCVQNAYGETEVILRKHYRYNKYRYQEVSYHHPEYSHHSSERNMIRVDLGSQIWEAYDDEGNLVRSGHVSRRERILPRYSPRV